MPRFVNHAPGQCIYAYCNVKTRQVLYSLTRTLRNKHLRQLPDTGANNNPPQLRKDLWRPLYSVHLPETKDGPPQGLLAYKMLRDFRVLHETTWEPPKRLSEPFTEKQIKKLEERLEQRGGSKKESPYDLIAQKKWKIRTQMVMNQKANSIADLAAVLLKQEVDAEKQERKKEKARARERKEMQDLATQFADNEVRRPLRYQIGDLQKAIGNHTYNEGGESKRIPRRLARDLAAAQLRLDRMKFAQDAVAQAKVDAENVSPEETEKRVAAALEAREEASVAQEGEGAPESSPPPFTEEERAAAEAAIRENLWTDFLPEFPKELHEPILKSKLRKYAPKPSHQHLVFSQKGVTVRWANTLDAEYAEQWPAEVRHEPMGYVRNTAPSANEEDTFLDYAVYKAAGEFRTKKQNWPVDEGVEREIEERRKKWGLVPHPNRSDRFVKGDAQDVQAEAEREAEREGDRWKEQRRKEQRRKKMLMRFGVAALREFTDKYPGFRQQSLRAQAKAEEKEEGRSFTPGLEETPAEEVRV